MTKSQYIFYKEIRIFNKLEDGMKRVKNLDVFKTKITLFLFIFK